MNKYYYQASSTASNVYVGDNIVMAGSADDSYSLGKSLSGNDLPHIIQAKIDAKELPEDTNALYFVLTAGDVKETIREDRNFV
jgi:hypothetical protein